MVVQEKGGRLSDEVGELLTGDDAPLRMAAHPGGRALVLAMGKGGLQSVDVQPQPDGPPTLMLATGACKGLAVLIC